MKLLTFVALAALVTISAADANSPAPVQGRIWQGTAAANGQFPYAVSLGFCNNANVCIMCTGALIGARWVLTVAQCLLTEGTINVYLGSVNRNAPAVTQSLPYTAATAHPDYNPSNRHNAIAVIAINPVELTPTLNIVALPDYSQPMSLYQTQTGTLMGWGAKVNGGALQNTLQYGTGTIRANKQCGQTTDLIDSQLCTDTSTSALCGGDDGAPLVVNGILVGLGSYQVGLCDVGNSPAVFIRVTSFRWWIEKLCGI